LNVRRYRSVKLYDARGYDKGPFTTFHVGGVDPDTGMRPRVTCTKAGGGTVHSRTCLPATSERLVSYFIYGALRSGGPCVPKP
jgi:hypothetical protein